MNGPYVDPRASSPGPDFQIVAFGNFGDYLARKNAETFDTSKIVWRDGPPTVDGATWILDAEDDDEDES